jgi:hypothetical protein
LCIFLALTLVIGAPLFGAFLPIVIISIVVIIVAFPAVKLAPA